MVILWGSQIVVLTSLKKKTCPNVMQRILVVWNNFRDIQIQYLDDRFD